MKMFLTMLGIAHAAVFPMFAATIGPGCTGCDGATYTVTDTTIAGGLEVSFTMDGSGYTGTLPAFLANFALGFDTPVTGAALVSAPGGNPNWALASGALDTTGCSGIGDAFECVGFVGGGPGADISGGPLQFVLDIFTNVPPGVGTTVQARVVDSGGATQSFVNSAVDVVPTAVPEPTTPWLCAVGLGALALVRRAILQ